MRYRRLFEAAKDGILILHAGTGEIRNMNPFLVDMLGYGKAEFIGKELWEIGLFKDVVANKTAFLKLQQERYVRYEHLPLRTKGGRAIWVEFVSNVYDVEGKQVIQCNIRDITEQKRIEQQMQRAQRLESIGTLAGGIAHDLNNILTPIMLSLEVLGRLPDAQPVNYSIC